MSLPKVLKLLGGTPTIGGTGEELVLTVQTFRTRAGQQSYRGELQLTVDRWFVRALANELREMQTRDRQRIDREIHRLRDEVAPLQLPPKETT